MDKQKLKNPFSQIKEPMNHDIYERFIQSFDPNTIVTQIYEDVTSKIESNLKALNPDLLINFDEIYKELTNMMKGFDKTIATIERKVKKLVESSSLTEDIYKTRDEVKILRKKMDKFNNGLKSLARLTETEDEISK